MESVSSRRWLAHQLTSATQTRTSSDLGIEAFWMLSGKRFSIFKNNLHFITFISISSECSWLVVGYLAKYADGSLFASLWLVSDPRPSSLASWNHRNGSVCCVPLRRINILRPNRWRRASPTGGCGALLGAAEELSSVPDILSSLTLLYFDDNRNVVLKDYPSMTAESCACRWTPRPPLWPTPNRQKSTEELSIDGKR